MGGCFGCFTKPKLKSPSDERSKRSSIQSRKVKKSSISEDFWTTSTCDMDDSAAQSQGSMCSINTTNHMLDPNGVSSMSNAPFEFINHGLLLWNQTRLHWLGNKSKLRSDYGAQQNREPKFNWNATYESLLGSNKPFPQPIPLSEMVDFLVDVWEQEGLYD